MRLGDRNRGHSKDYLWLGGETYGQITKERRKNRSLSSLGPLRKLALREAKPENNHRP